MGNFNRFAKGSACFTCRDCGKRTRDTGGGNGGVELCPVCYAKAGAENTLQDTSGFKGDAYAAFANCKTVAEVDDRLAELVNVDMAGNHTLRVNA